MSAVGTIFEQSASAVVAAAVPPATRRPLHMAFGVLSLDLGGLERLVLDLVTEFSGRGDRVSVVCVERRGRLAGRAEELGAEVFCLDKPAGRSRGTVERGAELLSRLRPDVVHTHQIGALYYLGQAAERVQGSGFRVQGAGGRGQGTAGGSQWPGVGGRGIVVVHTEHSDHARQARGVRAKVKNRLLLGLYSRWAGRFCCVSEDVARSVRRWGTVPGGKVRVVRNGIQLRGSADCGLRIADLADKAVRGRVRGRFGIGVGEFVFGTVGRLAEVKRQDLLIRAFAKIRVQGSGFRGQGAGGRGQGVGQSSMFKDEGGRMKDGSRIQNSEFRVQNAKRIRLLIVGDGGEREGLEGLARELGVADDVIFAGYQAEPEVCLQAMDAFVLSSRHEALPLALLEAMAAGLPVVSTAVGGIPDVIESGRTGVLVPALDEGALAAAMERVAADGEFAAAIAEAGRRVVVEQYSLVRMADEYEAIYRELLGAKDCGLRIADCGLRSAE